MRQNVSTTDTRHEERLGTDKMLKIFTVFALFTIGGVWTAELACGSCGSECAPACGTRRFRICCFNHLRRKRTELPQIDNDLEYDEDFPVEHMVLLIQKPEWLKKLVLGDDPYLIEDTKKLIPPLK